MRQAGTYTERNIDKQAHTHIRTEINRHRDRQIQNKTGTETEPFKKAD